MFGQITFSIIKDLELNWQSDSKIVSLDVVKGRSRKSMLFLTENPPKSQSWYEKRPILDYQRLSFCNFEG